SDVRDHTVGELLVEDGPVDAGAALHQDADALLLGQELQHLAERDTPVRTGGEGDHPGPGRLEGPAGSRRGSRPGGDQAPAVAADHARGRRATVPSSRVDSSGSSASTVPTPTRTASWRWRSRWPRWRAASPVIQRDSPAAVAMRPSREEANLAVTNGSPAVTQRRYCSLSSRAASASTPTVTSMPARRRLSRPPPLTRGLGSGMAATQREMPAA